MKNNKYQAIDLFSGAGGLTQGLKQAGFQVIGAVEYIDKIAESYSLNHCNTKMYNEDISKLDPGFVREEVGVEVGELDLLAGCPPCQGFSTIGPRFKGVTNDPRNELVYQMSRFAKEFLPKTIMMENVPALAKDYRLQKLVVDLEGLGYIINYKVLNTSDFGVPQSRRRMILFASQFDKLEIPEKDQKLQRKLTVRDAISRLEDSSDSKDPLHNNTVNYTDKTLNIIKHIPKNGGSRTDLPEELRLECHKKTSGFKDVYGRMSWDKPSPTITGGCTSASKGRFIHPEKDRAITLREAALLQTFPKNYKFSPNASKQGVATMIGNALPPKFIEFHAREILKHLQNANGGEK